MLRVPCSYGSLLTAALLAFAATPAPAQQQRSAADPPSVLAAAMVGRWLYGDRGEIVGSVKAVSLDKRTATVVLGVYMLDQVRVVELPDSALSIVDGRVTLRTGTAQVRNVPSPHQG